METSPFGIDVLFYIGPVPIGRSVVTTWVIMAVLTFICWFGLRRPRVHAGTIQTVLEIIVEAISKQIGEIIRRDTWRYMPLLATLFIFLVCANLTAIVPGLKPPTGHLETPAALAAIVFFPFTILGFGRAGSSTMSGDTPNPTCCCFRSTCCPKSPGLFR